MKPIKLIKHIREVGWKHFREEYKTGKVERNLDPTVTLKMQIQGYVGVIGFSLITAGVFIWQGFWTIAGIFAFNILIQVASLINTRSQLKMFNEIKNQNSEN